VTRTCLLAGCFLVVGLSAFGCTDNSGNGNGNPGAGGSSGGGTGGGGTGTGGSSSGGNGGASASGTGGTTPGFMAVLPCTAESNYMTGTTTIAFPADPTDFSYNPTCLKVPVGTTVTFSGDFTAHPLTPSAKRGAQTGSPITATSAGTSKDFTFATAGFYGYYCANHDPTDTGMFMSGVIWVQ